MKSLIAALFLLLAGSAIYTGLASASNEPPGRSTEPQAPANPNQAANDRVAQQLAKTIAGRENDPAEKVFKNITWLKGVPAGRLLLIMNAGYSRALGVACTHCHVEDDFSSDEKRPKRAAREMAAMHRMINDQLQKMENIETRREERFINCATCHRGAVSPLAASR